MASGAGEYPPLPGRLRHRHGGSGGRVSGVAEMVPGAASGIGCSRRRGRHAGKPTAPSPEGTRSRLRLTHRNSNPSRDREEAVAGVASIFEEVSALSIRARLRPARSPAGRRVNFGVVSPKLTTEDREKRSAAFSSLLAAVALTAMKTIVGLLTGSLGILAEAAHSGLDLVAALMTYIAVRISGKPADRTHLYGHGKVENLSALLETLLLFVTCGWIIQ